MCALHALCTPFWDFARSLETPPKDPTPKSHPNQKDEQPWFEAAESIFAAGLPQFSQFMVFWGKPRPEALSQFLSCGSDSSNNTMWACRDHPDCHSSFASSSSETNTPPEQEGNNYPSISVPIPRSVPPCSVATLQTDLLGPHVLALAVRP